MRANSWRADVPTVGGPSIRINLTCVDRMLSTAAILAYMLLPVSGFAAELSVNNKIVQAVTKGQHAASFDCGKATTKVEMIICSDHELSKLDESLSNAYKKILKLTNRKQDMIESQREWLKRVRNKCKNAECIRNAYEGRIKKLRSLSYSAQTRTGQQHEATPKRLTKPQKEISVNDRRDNKYTLLMSKYDCLYQHMLRLYNADIEQYGQVKYELHKEFHWIKWDKKIIHIRPLGVPEGVTEILDAKIAIFDINSDSRDEAIVYTESWLSNSPMDVYDVFNLGDIALLNETVDGSVYYKKSLKRFYSVKVPPVKISDISEEDLEKFPKKVRYGIEATKKRGNKYAYWGDGEYKINFLKLKDRFYVTFEEFTNTETLTMALDRFYREGGDPKTSRRSNQWLLKGFNRLINYSIVLEYQKDNNLNIQCLYLRKDFPAKAEVK
jgi:uncharacterized protein YecT (DUF1311 family)